MKYVKHCNHLLEAGFNEACKIPIGLGLYEPSDSFQLC